MKTFLSMLLYFLIITWGILHWLWRHWSSSVWFGCWVLHSDAVYCNLILGFNIFAILTLPAGCSLGINTFTHLFHVCLTVLVSKPYRNQCLVVEHHRVMAPESLWFPACPSWGCAFPCCSCFCTSWCWAGNAAYCGGWAPTGHRDHVNQSHHHHIHPLPNVT